MVTIRLDPALEEAISKTVKKLGLTKSELIRQSIIEYLDRLKKPTAWELGKDISGRHSSGMGNLSVDHRNLVKDKIKAKRK